MLLSNSVSSQQLAVNNCRVHAQYLTTEILHHCQQQAFRPVPQKINFLMGQAGKPVHKRLIENGATYELLQTNISAVT